MPHEHSSAVGSTVDHDKTKISNCLFQQIDIVTVTLLIFSSHSCFVTSTRRYTQPIRCKVRYSSAVVTRCHKSCCM